MASSTGFAVAKGAALIAFAIIIGIVLLQVVDDGSSGPVSTGTTESADTTTTTSSDSASTTTTAAAEGPARSPAEITVLVLNGGAPSGSAGQTSEELRSVGYVTQLPASDDDQNRDGNTVMCQEGFEREAQTLALAVGTGTPFEPMRDPAPPGSEDADCVVIVGRPVS
jgi:hypothetical protein